jgi:hypothetical protein
MMRKAEGAVRIKKLHHEEKEKRNCKTKRKFMYWNIEKSASIWREIS